MPLVSAEHAGRIGRIGYLSLGAPEVNVYASVFERGLRELGYVDGRNIAIEWRWAHDDVRRLSELVSELVRLSPDVVVTPATPPTLAAAKATATIPIVFIGVSAPVEQGIVSSLARPGKNITGLAFDVSAEVSVKRLQLLREIVPGAARVAVFRFPGDYAGTALHWNELQSGSRAMGIALEPMEISRFEDFEPAFRALTLRPPDALLVPGGTLGLLHRKILAQFAAQVRLPAIYAGDIMARDGGLMSYGPSLRALFRRAAAYVDKILKGAKPGDLPVEQPTNFELVINLKAAKALGIAIPPSLLARADEVIE